LACSHSRSSLRLFALILAWGTEPIGDPLNYLRLAHNLLAGDGLSLPRTAIGPELVSTALFPPGLAAGARGRRSRGAAQRRNIIPSQHP
jgi:hypothetical protein